VAIVNEAFARQFFPQQEPLGKRISMAPMKEPEPYTIVGIVSDVREMGPKRPMVPAVYITMAQVPLPVIKGVFSFVSSKWVVRVRPGAANIVPQLRAAAGALDAAQPFQEFRSMETMVASAARLERFLMVLLGAFAVLTLLMVAGGIYGTLAYMVTQRRQDIGIRMALGARSHDVIAMVVSSGARQVLLGLVAGLIGSYWATALMTGFLFQMKPLDAASYGAATVVLLAAGLLACAGPGITAARMDPVRTLRMD
jgi:putative ABC transport system permease protein